MLWNENIFPFSLYILPALAMSSHLVVSTFSVIVVSCSVKYASVCYAMRVDYEIVSLETVLNYTYVSL